MKKLSIAVLCLCLIILPITVNAAVGDSVASCTSVASGATLDVQPSGSIEWVIHNIWFEYDVELQRYDGTNTAVIKQFTGGDWQNFFPAIHVTNGNRIRVKNLHGSLAKVICYDGVVTK